MTSKLLKIGAALFALIALIIIGTIIFANNLPEVSDQLKSTTSPVIVTLTQPVNDSTWARNLFIPIEASVSPFTSVASIELWVDGQQVTKDKSTAWSIALQTEGEHTFFVRVIDTKGRVADSNVVRVIASANSDQGALLLQPIKAGDTIASLAANFNTTPQQIIDANPGLDPNASPSPGNSIKIPIQPPPLAPANNPTPAAPIGPLPNGAIKPPSKFSFWISQFFTPNAPPAPELSAQVNQCAVNLAIMPKSKLSQNTNVYRFDAATNVFVKIATLADSSGNPIGFTDPNRNGNVLYYVSAFNAAGESPSNIVSADVIDPTCLTPFWIGVKLNQTSLKLKQSGPDIIPTKYDQAYFYLSINNSVSIRLPADPNAFLTLPDGFFNPDEQIKNFVQPTTQDQAVEIDAWGWSAGKLLHIGIFQRTVPALKQNTSLPANYTVSQLVACSACKGDSAFDFTDFAATSYEGFQNLGYRWHSDPSNADHGLWQVSLSAFPNDCDVNPAGLVGSGQVAVSNGYSFFSIDLTFLKDKLPNIGDTAYIRIIPFANGQPICQPSNTLRFSIVAPTTPQYLPTQPPVYPLPETYQAKIVDFTPIQPGDVVHQNCVLIVKNPYLDDPAYYFGTKGTPAEAWTNAATHYVGATLCPSAYVNKSKSLWDDLADAINFVSDTFSTLKGYAVTLADELNPLCIQAKLVSSGNKTVKDVCNAIAEVTVDIGLAYVGIPPSLPNYDELENASKGYVADLAVEQLGDDCPVKETCKDLIKQGLDLMIAKVKESQNGSQCFPDSFAAARGYNPICEPKGAITLPSPLGQVRPATVKVQITRLPDVPTSNFPDPNAYIAHCSFGLSSQADNNSWIGQPIQIGLNSKGESVNWIGTNINGDLFQGVGGKIPKMAVGQTLIVPFALTFASADFDSFRTPMYDHYTTAFWLPDRLGNLAYWASVNQTAVKDTNAYDWRYLYSGATATFKLSGTCKTNLFQGYYGASAFEDTLITSIPSIGP